MATSSNRAVVKRKLEIKMKLGTFSIIDGLVVPEILSRYLDFLILDSEHGLENLSEQKARYLASKTEFNKGCEVFIRVPSLSRIDIQRYLEIGADGILVPQISSFEQASQAIEFSFYPPLGSRGVSPYTRPFGYEPSNLVNKKKKINKDLKLSLLIEGAAGIKDLKKILKKYSESIFLIYFGLFDFANSLGLDADLANPKIRNGIIQIIKMCNEANVRIGTIATENKNINLLNDLGVEYIVFKNDVEILKDGIPYV